MAYGFGEWFLEVSYIQVYREIQEGVAMRLLKLKLPDILLTFIMSRLVCGIFTESVIIYFIYILLITISRYIHIVNSTHNY